VGIGLALVKELVEIQTGKVSVISKEGVGTTFTVSLPYVCGKNALAQSKTAAFEESKAAGDGAQVSSQEWLSNLYRRAELFPAMTPVQEAVRQHDSGSEGDKRPTLLVADDEPDMLRFLKSQLSTHYKVIDVTDGAQAVEKAARHLPDIILLDMMMPEKDGMQACRELREKPETQSTPIIMLTARADEETKLTALSAGANDFLPKPFSTTELHVRIKNLVESHHYQMQVSKQNQALSDTIEQLKETETMLVQTEKMVSLGRMSAGIIHEMNNPLNYATTGLFTLRNKAKFLATDQQAEYSEVLQEIEEGILRVKNIVTDLRSFTHPDTELLDTVEVSPAINLALRFLSNEWKGKVLVHQSVPETLVVRGNRNKLVQVFVNMFQNSLDAMRGKQFNGEKPAISIQGREENGKVFITIRDNGEGMDADTIAKVFDPFFTTKDVGEGMGLGLTICYRIIEESDGRITVNSERGKYCEFNIEFPNPAAPAPATNGADGGKEVSYEQQHA
jgi:C4-dicarboxylate-specific signal transduction histidine kinase